MSWAYVHQTCAWGVWGVCKNQCPHGESNQRRSGPQSHVLAIEPSDNLTIEHLILAYTSSFHDLNEGLPCDKASHFYLANWNVDNWKEEGVEAPTFESLVSNDRYDKPCKQSAQGCAVYTHLPTSFLLCILGETGVTASMTSSVP
jgi:hypothetical protein